MRRSAFGLALAAASGLAGCAGAAPSGLASGRQRCVECAIAAGPAPEAMTGAAERFAAGCSRGQGTSCSALGLMHQHGRGVPHDLARATALLERACQLGNKRGCIHLGRLLQSGEIGRHDQPGAALMFELGCEQGESEGCYRLAELRYQQGRSAEARRALEQACDDEHALACLGLGALAQHGRGVARSWARAHRYYLHACQLGEPTACKRVGETAVLHPSRIGGGFGARQPLDPAGSP